MRPLIPDACCRLSARRHGEERRKSATGCAKSLAKISRLQLDNVANEEEADSEFASPKRCSNRAWLTSGVIPSCTIAKLGQGAVEVTLGPGQMLAARTPAALP